MGNSLLENGLLRSERLARRFQRSLVALADRFREGFGSAVELEPGEFLKRFEIPAVQAALSRRDDARAQQELISHYTKRVNESWPEPPAELTDLRIRLHELSAAELKRLADDILAHKVPPTKLQPRLSSSGVVDWTHNPTSDREWLLKINRHAWWVVLGLAYRDTRDDRYAARFVEQMLDWIDNNPPSPRKDERSPTWRLMEVGLRVRVSWIPSFGLFYDAPSFTSDAKLKMLRSLYDHGRFLLRFKTERNHLLRESNGLASLGATFPEFREARSWVNSALERIEAEIREQVNDDGTHIEMSTAYQWLVIDELERTAELLRTHDLQMPGGDLDASLEKLYDVAARVLLPDGTIPQINDGFLLWPHTRLADAGRRYSRPDLVYAGTDGAEGTPPPHESCRLRDAGLHVMRSDFTKDARFLIFDTGPHGGAHGHEDKLSIVELCAYGERFLADPGSFTYDKKNPYRSYFAGSSGHNTVLVDGKSQVGIWNPANRRPGIARGNYSTWVCREAFDYASGAYDEGYGDYKPNRLPGAEFTKDVLHERRVLFVKPDYWIIVDRLETTQDHRYEWLFHAPRRFQVSQENSGRVILGENGTASPQLLIDPVIPDLLRVDTYCGSEDPIQGWYSPDHRVKEPATAVSYSHAAKGRFDAAFLLYPTPTGISPSARVDTLELSRSTASLVVTRESGARDYLLIASEAASRELGPHRVSGVVAVVRTDAKGNVTSRDEWPGDPAQQESEALRRSHAPKTLR